MGFAGEQFITLPFVTPLPDPNAQGGREGTEQDRLPGQREPQAGRWRQEDLRR